MGERYLRSIRLLAECMQLFERNSNKAVRALGLTHSQFDIIATLGNTPGMTCKVLGEKTLITKGTLTGILDRMESKKLITRERRGGDKRQLFIQLTPEGEALFEETFPKVVASGKRHFSAWEDADFSNLEAHLLRLKADLERKPE